MTGDSRPGAELLRHSTAVASIEYTRPGPNPLRSHHPKDISPTSSCSLLNANGKRPSTRKGTVDSRQNIDTMQSVSALALNAPRCNTSRSSDHPQGASKLEASIQDMVAARIQRDVREASILNTELDRAAHNSTILEVDTETFFLEQAPLSPDSNPDIDEGYGEGTDDQSSFNISRAFRFRRAADPSGSFRPDALNFITAEQLSARLGHAVRCNPRVRKRKRLGHVRSPIPATGVSEATG